jgi:hypothetical protein
MESAGLEIRAGCDTVTVFGLATLLWWDSENMCGSFIGGRIPNSGPKYLHQPKLGVRACLACKLRYMLERCIPQAE